MEVFQVHFSISIIKPFYFLYFCALIPGTLPTLEGMLLPGIDNP